MKRAAFFLLLCFLLSGCATYKFSHGKGQYESGYVASRDDYTIVEYTVGENNSVPKDLKLAEERFQRRKTSVEEFYKKMGLIESRFRQMIAYPKFMLAVISGPFRLPFAAVNDYKYEHDAKYREMVKNKDKEQELKEKERIAQLRDSLNKYIQRDLKAEEMVYAKYGKPVEAAAVAEPVQIKETPQEKPPLEQAEIPAQEAQTVEKKLEVKEPAEKVQQQEVIVAEPKQTPVELKEEPSKTEETPIEAKATPVAVGEAPVEEKEIPAEAKELPTELKAPPETKETPALVEAVSSPETVSKVSEKEKTAEVKKKTSAGPRAYIMAKPIKGYSPLKVQFYGNKSFSPSGRIAFYQWDFGDGDTSTKVNPVNTFYSVTSEPKRFPVTLTVTDNKGNSSTATTEIEVLNK